jgi:putative intracellular protease/amidase
MAEQKKPIAASITRIVQVTRLPYLAGQEVTLLLADSQPLFGATVPALITAWVRAANLQAGLPVCGIYCGAANGDQAQYFDIAQGFFSQIGVLDAVHWGCFGQAELPAAEQPCIVILAGGSVARGARVVVAEPWLGWLQQRHAAGRIVLGISAGAIHLTAGLNELGSWWHGYRRQNLTVCVHEERQGWPSLHCLYQQGVDSVLCLPFSAAVCLSDQEGLKALCGEPFMASRIVAGHQDQ